MNDELCLFCGATFHSVGEGDAMKLQRVMPLPSTELKDDCGAVFQSVSEAELTDMTTEQRNFLETWG